MSALRTRGYKLTEAKQRRPDNSVLGAIMKQLEEYLKVAIASFPRGTQAKVREDQGYMGLLSGVMVASAAGTGVSKKGQPLHWYIRLEMDPSRMGAGVSVRADVGQYPKGNELGVWRQHIPWDRSVDARQIGKYVGAIVYDPDLYDEWMHRS